MTRSATRLAAAITLSALAVTPPADAGHRHRGGCQTGQCGQPVCATGLCLGPTTPTAAELPPTTVDRGALLPLSMMEARIVLNVPSSAIVYFGSQLMHTRGTQRVYRIPVTQSGTVFPYPMTVIVPGERELLIEDLSVRLMGGLETELDVLVKVSPDGDKMDVKATSEPPAMGDEGLEEEQEAAEAVIDEALRQEAEDESTFEELPAIEAN